MKLSLEIRPGYIGKISFYIQSSPVDIEFNRLDLCDCTFPELVLQVDKVKIATRDKELNSLSNILFALMHELSDMIQRKVHYPQGPILITEYFNKLPMCDNEYFTIVLSE